MQKKSERKYRLSGTSKYSNRNVPKLNFLFLTPIVLHIWFILQAFQYKTSKWSESIMINHCTHRYAFVKSGDKCSSCGFPLMTRGFYVFPCGHKFHNDCLVSEVRTGIHTFSQERLTCDYGTMVQISWISYGLLVEIFMQYLWSSVTILFDSHMTILQHFEWHYSLINMENLRCRTRLSKSRLFWEPIFCMFNTTVHSCVKTSVLQWRMNQLNEYWLNTAGFYLLLNLCTFTINYF